MLSTFTDLQNLELEKNNFKEFFPDAQPAEIRVKSLSYLNLNGNQLTVVPEILRYFSGLKQLHLHMNKITSVNNLCRPKFQGLEVLDLGVNKISEIPIALIFYLKAMSQLVLVNNDI